MKTILSRNIIGKNIPIFRRFAVTRHELHDKIIEMKNRNIIPIIDYAVESKGKSNETYSEIKNTLEYYDNNFHALKLSGIKELIDNDDYYLNNIIETSKKHSNKILIDAEDSDLDKYICDKTNYLIKSNNIDNVHIYKTYQMYRKDSLPRLIYDIDYARNNNFHLGIKLVRGAYYNDEIKKNIVYENKEETDNNYNDGLRYIFSNMDLEKNSLIIASHNEKSINLTKELFMDIMKKDNDKKLFNIYFATLLGMKDNICHELIDQDYKVMKYIPYGDIYDLFPYLMRRLNENKYMLKHVW
jgi:proline dehydrogenase